MNEAESYINQDVYMVFIAEKSSKVVRIGAIKEVKYKEILANRGSGWHACDEKHCERSSAWKATFAKWGTLFEIA